MGLVQSKMCYKYELRYRVDMVLFGLSRGNHRFKKTEEKFKEVGLSKEVLNIEKARKS